MRKPSLPGIELGEGAFRPRVIGRLDLGDRQRQFERMDAQFGLDLEPPDSTGKDLTKRRENTR